MSVVPDGGAERDGTGDGTTIDVGTTCASDARFDTVEPLATLNGERDDSHPALTRDELTVVFTRTEQAVERLFYATRASRNDPFGEPKAIGGGVGNAGAAFATLSPDGSTIVFASQRAGAAGGPFRLYRATRASEGRYEGVTLLDSLQAGDATDVTPALSSDLSRLLFASTRGGGRLELFEAEWNGGTPKLLGRLDTPGAPAVRTSPVLASNGQTLFFSAGAPDGDKNVYLAQRANAGAPLGTAVRRTDLSNDTTDEAPGWLSDDGCRLYFHTNGRGARGFDIFMASR